MGEERRRRVPEWMREEGVEELPKDMLDLEIDMEAVEKQREYRVLPRLEIPEPDKPSIEVEIAGEPYKVENPKMRTGFGYFLNVIDKKDGMLKQITYPKTLAQAMIANDIYRVIDGCVVRDGQRLKIGKQRMPPGYRTRRGEIVEGGESIVVEKTGEREAEAREEAKEVKEEAKPEERIVETIRRLGSVRVARDDIVNELAEAGQTKLLPYFNGLIDELLKTERIAKVGEGLYSLTE